MADISGLPHFVLDNTFAFFVFRPLISAEYFLQLWCGFRWVGCCSDVRLYRALTFSFH